MSLTRWLLLPFCCNLTAAAAHPPTLNAPRPLLLSAQANSWRPLADMADSRAYGSAAVVGGEVYAVGGLQSDMQVRGAGLSYW